MDERFVSSRASARSGGYTSSSGDDDAFVTPRALSARSWGSDAEYASPRGLPYAVHTSARAQLAAQRRPQSWSAPHSGAPFGAVSSAAGAAGAAGAAAGSGVGSSDNGSDFVSVSMPDAEGAAEYALDMGAGPEVQGQGHSASWEHVGVFGASGVSEADMDKAFSLARHGRTKELQAVLDCGLPVDARDRFGNTMLLVACQNGLKRVAKLVLRNGADINVQNHKGNTALHYCFAYGYGDTLGEYLISKGADPDIRNNSGCTCHEGLET